MPASQSAWCCQSNLDTAPALHHEGILVGPAHCGGTCQMALLRHGDLHMEQAHDAEHSCRFLLSVWPICQFSQRAQRVKVQQLCMWLHDVYWKSRRANSIHSTEVLQSPDDVAGNVNATSAQVPWLDQSSCTSGVHAAADSNS